jgi:hypothetical protein
MIRHGAGPGMQRRAFNTPLDTTLLQTEPLASVATSAESQRSRNRGGTAVLIGGGLEVQFGLRHPHTGNRKRRSADTSAPGGHEQLTHGWAGGLPGGADSDGGG